MRARDYSLFLLRRGSARPETPLLSSRVRAFISRTYVYGEPIYERNNKHSCATCASSQERIYFLELSSERTTVLRKGKQTNIECREIIFLHQFSFFNLSLNYVFLLMSHFSIPLTLVSFFNSVPPRQRLYIGSARRPNLEHS